MGIYEWRPNEDPWEVHALFSRKCGFLIKTKGEEFIRKVHSNDPYQVSMVLLAIYSMASVKRKKKCADGTGKGALKSNVCRLYIK